MAVAPAALDLGRDAVLPEADLSAAPASAAGAIAVFEASEVVGDRVAGFFLSFPVVGFFLGTSGYTCSPEVIVTSYRTIRNNISTDGKVYGFRQTVSRPVHGGSRIAGNPFRGRAGPPSERARWLPVRWYTDRLPQLPVFATQWS